MVFIVAHYNTEAEAEQIRNFYLKKYNQVLLCGTSSFEMPLTGNIPYHPIVCTINGVDIRMQHAFIDTMMRALQIETPEALVLHSNTALDSETVWYRICAHAEIVQVPIIRMH